MDMNNEDLSDEEKGNLEFFSHPRSLEAYNSYGLRTSEEKAISKYFQGGFRILDVGCGEGRTTVCLKEKGFDVVGIDIVPKMIELAQKSFQILILGL